MLKGFIEFIGENLSIDLESVDSELRFASNASKKTMNIKKNENYLKKGKPLNSVVTVTAYGKPYNYQVYVMGNPLNIKSIEPSSNNNVKITYYTGEMSKSDPKKYETKTAVKSLDLLKDYLPDLIKGNNINPTFIPFKLVRV